VAAAIPFGLGKAGKVLKGPLAKVLRNETGAVRIGATGRNFKITKFAGHGINQIINRGLRPSEILNILRNGTRSAAKHGRVKIRRPEGHIILDPDGTLVTAVHYKSPGGP
jgi:hypothetical protein